MSVFLCVCGIVPFGESFRRLAPAKSTLRLKAGCQHEGVTSYDAEKAPRTATTHSEPCQPPHPLMMKVVSPFHNLVRKETQVNSQARPLAFPPHCSCWSWADARRWIQAGAQSSALCTSPLWCLLGITGMGGSSLTNTVLQRNSGQSESCQV